MDPDPAVRMRVVEHGRTRALVLAALTGDPDREVRGAARASLIEIMFDTIYAVVVAVCRQLRLLVAPRRSRAAPRAVSAS